MKKQKNQNHTLILLGIFLSFVFIGIFSFLQNSFNVSLQVNKNFKSHTNDALKISFKYPSDWYVNEKHLDILVTSYKTVFGDNTKPTNKQIELFINTFGGCFESIEENLMNPACGEGGSSVLRNTISSKEVRETLNGVFYKYIIHDPNFNTDQTFYLLENKDRVLQISKQPDPSEFEKEFEDIVASIRFL